MVSGPNRTRVKPLRRGIWLAALAGQGLAFKAGMVGAPSRTMVRPLNGI